MLRVGSGVITLENLAFGGRDSGGKEHVEGWNWAENVTVAFSRDNTKFSKC